MQQLKEIGTRLADLREVKGISVDDMSQKLGITVDEYIDYENGENDFSFSFLYNVASILEVDVMDIMSGSSPTLTRCAIVKANQGFNISKEGDYDYKHLAFTFKDKKADPFLVTVYPDKNVPELHAHDGQEFNYIVSGKMRFYIDQIFYELNPGDSIYFDSSIPHAEKAVGEDVLKFVAVVIR